MTKKTDGLSLSKSERDFLAAQLEAIWNKAIALRARIREDMPLDELAKDLADYITLWKAASEVCGKAESLALKVGVTRVGRTEWTERLVISAIVEGRDPWKYREIADDAKRRQILARAEQMRRRGKGS